MRTLFLVENSSIVRERFGALLSALPGLAVVGQAEDAPSAITCILRLRPDLVLLDIRLRVGNGIEVLKAIRPQLLDAVLIMMSSEPSEQRRRQCFASGADYFFDKTLEFGRIIELISSRV